MRIAILAVTMSIFGCAGGESSQVMTSGKSSASPYSSISTNDAVVAATCTQASCDKGSIELGPNGLFGQASLTMTQDQPAQVSFTGRHLADSARVIMPFFIQATPASSSLVISGNGTTSVSLTATMRSADPTQGTLQVTSRDVTRCRVMTSGSASCEDYSVTNDYDHVSTVTWSKSAVASPSTNSGGSGSDLIPLIGVLGGVLIGGQNQGGVANCAYATNQMTCAQTYGCAWNQLTMTCMSGGSTGTNCAYAANQIQCSQTFGCAWNQLVMRCQSAAASNCQYIQNATQCVQSGCNWIGSYCQ